MPLTDEEREKRRKKLEAAGAAPDKPPLTPEERAARLETINNFEESMGPKGGPGGYARSKQKLADEYDLIPPGERLERQVRLSAGNIALGVGDVATLPVAAAAWAARTTQKGRTWGRTEGSTPILDEISGGIRSKFEGINDAIVGDIKPMTPGENFNTILTQEAAAGFSLGTYMRKKAKQMVAAGSKSGFLKAMADEKYPMFLSYEGLGALGATGGRAFADGAGGLSESLMGMAGGTMLTVVPSVGIRTIKWLNQRLNVQFDKISAQELKLWEELVSKFYDNKGNYSHEKFVEVMSDPAHAHIIHDVAERLQRQAGGHEASLEAVRKMDENYAKIDDFNTQRASDFAEEVDPSGFSAMELTENAGLQSTGQVAAKNNPRIATAFAAMWEPASRALNKIMVALGPPIDSKDVENVRQLIRVDAHQRKLKIMEPQLRAEGQADEAIGGYAGDSARAKEVQGDASEEYLARVGAARDAQKTEIVDVLRDKVRAYSEANPHLKFSPKNSKAAVADLEDELGAMGELDAPSPQFGVVKSWSADGIPFNELWDARTKLGNQIGIAYKAGDRDRVRMLTKIWEGVDADIKNFEFLDDIDVLPTTGAPDPIPVTRQLEGRPGDTAAGLPRERSVEKNIDDTRTARQKRHAGIDAEHEARKRAVAEGRDFKDPVRPGAQYPDPLRPEAPLPPKPPGGTAGTPGTTRGRGDDNPVGMPEERTRAEMGRLVENYNAAYRQWAEEWKDPVVTGQFAEAARRRNPVAHSESLRDYLNPNKKGYRERVADLRARTDKSAAALKNTEDYLFADAYAASVGWSKPDADGVRRAVMIPDKLDKWRGRNHEALKAYPRVEKAMREGHGFAERARAIGARPGADDFPEQLEALRRFSKDPEIYWDQAGRFGSERALREIDDLIKTVSKSGDKAAMEGLRQSFWQSQVVKAAERHGAAHGTREVTFSAIENVLGNRQLKKTLTRLYGTSHVRLLQEAADIQLLANQTAKIPADIKASKLLTPTEAGEEFLTRASAFSVILGPIRRTGKMAKALTDFHRALDERQVAAVIQQSAGDRGLLRDLLVINPDAATIKRIKTRLSMNMPTLFPRSWGAADRRKERREEEEGAPEKLTPEEIKALQKEHDERLRKQRGTSVNRGMLSPPGLSRPRSILPDPGRFA